MINYCIPVLLGWLAGISINYIADSLPETRRLSKVFCHNCGEDQSMLNYLFWPRRCQNCSKRRKNRTWIVEIVSIIYSTYLWASLSNMESYLAALILLLYFGVVTVIDIEHRLILHPVSISGGIVGVILGSLSHGLKSTLLGGVAGFCIMLILYYLGQLTMSLMSRLRGKTISEDALGFGDVNLSGTIGLILGWPGITIGLLLTIILAGATSLIYLLVKIILGQYKSDLALPYGPFLVISAVILLYF